MNAPSRRPLSIVSPIASAIAVLSLIVAVGSAAEAKPKAVPSATLADKAKAVYDAARAAFDSGRGSAEQCYTWSRRWLDAEISATTNARARRVAYAAHHGRMTALHAKARSMVQSGMAPALTALETEFFVAEAAAWKKSPPRR